MYTRPNHGAFLGRICIRAASSASAPGNPYLLRLLADLADSACDGSGPKARCATIPRAGGTDFGPCDCRPSEYPTGLGTEPAHLRPPGYASVAEVVYEKPIHTRSHHGSVVLVSLKPWCLPVSMFWSRLMIAFGGGKRCCGRHKIAPCRIIR